MKWYREIDWAGAVAMTLALGVSISMILGFAASVITQTPVSEGRAQILASIFGAAVGAIATYLGMSRSLASVRAGKSERLDDSVLKEK